MTSVVVSGWFDNIRSHDLRFLQETAALGDLTVLLWSDSAIQQVGGTPLELAGKELGVKVTITGPSKQTTFLASTPADADKR